MKRPTRKTETEKHTDKKEKQKLRSFSEVDPRELMNLGPICCEEM